MYSIPSNYIKELSNYREEINTYLNDRQNSVDLKINRVTHGVYEQRTKGTYMVRIRCAGGYISPNQLLQTAHSAKMYGSPFVHITTRQELQLHNLNIIDTPDILDELHAFNLSTKGSGGNTVRNIICSVESGVTNNQIFDVTPHTISLTNFLLEHPRSFTLPRKLKIAFSCSNEDTALAAFNDIGFIAKMQDGQKGFKVYIGGSPSVKPMIGYVLFDFVPENEIFRIALSVIELFNRYGNKKNRHKARLRYVFYKYGKEKVFGFFNEIYNKKDLTHTTNFKLNIQNRTEHSLQLEQNTLSEFNTWKQRYCTEQHNGLYTVVIPFLHGNVPVEVCKKIAEFLVPFGNDVIRFSRRQNIHLRNIPVKYLGNVYNLLDSLNVDIHKPYILGNLVCCTGADTCQLGICFSKGGLKAIYDNLETHNNLDNLNDLNINISGCPNSCGQHLVADIGFAGKISRKDRIYPAYNVFAGANLGNNPKLPKQIGEVSAKDLPRFTSELVLLYQKEKSGYKSFRDFVNSEEAKITSLLDKYKEIPSFLDDKSYYIDWGDNNLFSTEGRGGGECSAGIFDMINAEINAIKSCRESLEQQQETEHTVALLFELVLATSRLFLLTKNMQLSAEKVIFQLFIKYFIDSNIIDKKFAPLIDEVVNGNFNKVLKKKELVLEFANLSIDYYNKLDDSFNSMEP